MKKKLLKPLVLALAAVMLFGTPILAYSYSALITVTESDSNSYDMLPIIVSVNNTYLVDNDFISINGTDTRVLKSSTELPHMLTDNATLFASPISAGTQEGFTYTLGNLLLPAFNIITGYGGYITVADNETIELGNSFEIDMKGNCDVLVSNPATDNFVIKESAYRLWVSDNGTITSNIIGSANCTVSGLSNNLYRLVANYDGFTLGLYVYDAGDVLVGSNTTVCSDNVTDNGHDWIIMQKMRYAEYIKISASE